MANTTFRHIENPPITEAILEIIYTMEDDFDVNEFKSYTNSKSDEYTRVDEIFHYEGNIDIKNIEENTLKSKVVGYMCLDDDKSKAIQIRQNGFMFSISKYKYSNWADFFKEAWTEFDKIKDLYKILDVKRTSLRYINSINLPSSLEDIKEYILIAPIAPDNLSFSNMFMQMTIPNHDINANGIITQTFNVLDKETETFEYILDIDVQIMSDYDLDLVKIKADFEKLCNFKNEIFFKSITDKTLELF